MSLKSPPAWALPRRARALRFDRLAALSVVWVAALSAAACGGDVSVGPAADGGGDAPRRDGAGGDGADGAVAGDDGGAAGDDSGVDAKMDDAPLGPDDGGDAGSDGAESDGAESDAEGDGTPGDADAAGSDDGAGADGAATDDTPGGDSEDGDTVDVGPVTPPPAPVFVDVSAEAGAAVILHPDGSPGRCIIDFPSGTEGVGYCEPEYLVGGAAAGDYDGDGWIDIFLPRLEAPNVLLRNQGDGTFVDVAAEVGLTEPVNASGAGWIDVDNDGDLDLMVTTYFTDRYHLFINRNDRFTDEGGPRGAALDNGSAHLGWSVAVGDYDGDGWLDMYLGEWRPDIVDSAFSPSNAALLRNRGAAQPGFFDDRTELAGVSTDGLHNVGIFSFSPAFVDLDDDDRPDLAIAGDFGTSRLFWNNGDGTFVDGTLEAGVGTDENGMGSAFGDFDGDLRMDWFVASIYDPEETCDQPDSRCGWDYSGNRLYRNMGGRAFVDATDEKGVRAAGWGWGAAWLDYDNDGDQDLAMVSGFTDDFSDSAEAFVEDPGSLWRNDGLGVMPEIAAEAGLAGTRHGRGLLVLDYDRDGDLDLFVATERGTTRLLRNTAGDAGDAGRAWLRVDVKRAAGGRDAIGAVVTIRPTAGARAQRRVIGVNSHFVGQSEATAHFGLGGVNAPPVAEVRVRWPETGNERVYTNVAPRTTLVATPN